MSGVGILAMLTALLAFQPASPAAAADLSPSPAGTAGKGYFFVATDGGIFNFGDSKFFGSTGNITLNRPIVGAKSTPTGNGYWLVASDGGIFTFGDAEFLGSTGGMTLNRPIVGMAVTPSGNGYWLVATDGGIFSFGDAQFYGSTGAMTLNSPIVGMDTTADGNGYWLVAADGGIFTFGSAEFFGSAGAINLNRPIVGMAATADGDGYYLVATDGGIFTYGRTPATTPFYGSTGAIALNSPIVGMDLTVTDGGYYLVAADGGIFTFGDAQFYGSTGDIRLNRPVVGMSVTPFAPLAAPDFVVDLRGSKEVPGPGDPDGRGIAYIDLTTSGVCFGILVTGTTPTVAAHIHQAPAGVAGPIVVPLAPPDASGMVSGCVAVDPALIGQINADPAGFYVNLHTADFPGGSVRGQLEGQTVVVGTAGNRMTVLDSERPGVTIASATVTGLVAGESIVAIDVRPSTGQIYAMTSSPAGQRLYVVNASTFAATAVSASVYTLAGTSFGFDFNPTVDQIRVVSNTGENLRLDPTTGAVLATATPLAFAGGDPNAGVTPAVGGAAYINIVPVQASATLYDIESQANVLVTQVGDSGALNTVGPLGVDVTAIGGFDIAQQNLGASTTAIAVLNTAAGAGVYAINLTTGQATLLGTPSVAGPAISAATL